jgi:hypothetical protein
LETCRIFIQSPKLQNQFHSIPLILANQLMNFFVSTTPQVNQSKTSVTFGCTYLNHVGLLHWPCFTFKKIK